MRLKYIAWLFLLFMWITPPAFAADTKNVDLRALQSRIVELERQVKELQRLTEAPNGIIWCDNFDCYDSLGRKVEAWTIK